ncbi:coiled-coil domain-containing protein 158-like isoform X2 [Atheta coriaria]|uniref:coiled-coil domain-containing protein 158-like isoform X2 n=1 Tax=Dalotia coriaria TaxID=877792 RepID=UPI0031F33AA3
MAVVCNTTLSKGGEPGSGMDCLQLRQQPGPFHYLISEQAKSLVALQELQHEVGALLEFRDLVIETFPNLRTKMATSSPATMMTSNIPVAVRRDWEPGVRVRRKLHNKDESRAKKTESSAVQDSGFSTETSSKETHSASSSSAPPTSAPAAVDEGEAEDELWNLLDVIHRKGTRLKDEVEALQGALRDQGDTRKESDFQRVLFHASADDVRNLRHERDMLLDRVAEMEAEVLAGRVHTSRLQEDLENLLSTKQDLEDQLRNVVSQSGEVNSRIHDLHLQFVTKDADDRVQSACANKVCVSTSQRTISRRGRSDELDLALGDQQPKVALPDSKKIAAILKEYDPIVLQKHLLTSTVQNQVLQLQLDTAARLEQNLVDKLDKAREENDELKFQLEDRNIELEGTRAHVRMLENQKKPPSGKSPDIIPALDTASERTEISTSSMKAMSPFPINQQLDHSSSTESAQDQAENTRKSVETPRRRPSKIPLGKSYAAPKPPSGGKHSPALGAPRSRSGESPGRPQSAQSWRNNKSEGNSLSGSKSSTSLSKSRNGSLTTAKDSLTGKLRTSESLTRSGKDSSVTSYGGGGSTRGSTMRKGAAPATPVRRNNSIRDAPDSKIDLNLKKAQWILSASSYPSDVEQLYMDSLDRMDRTGPPMPSPSSPTKNFYWGQNQRELFYDSIDSNQSSSMYQGGEELAECDSLEKQISDVSDRKF